MIVRRNSGSSAGMRTIPLSALSYVIIDFETTGLNANDGDEVLEIGAVRVDGKTVTEKHFHTLVHPGRPVPAEAFRVHGIGDEELVGAPTIIDVMPDFMKFLGQGIIVAQNARFDLTFLVKNLGRMSISRLDNPVLDTMLLSRFLFSYESSHNLDAILGRLKIKRDETRHRSLGDCILTAHALVQMIDILEKRGLDTLDAIRACIVRPGPIPVQTRETISLF